MPRFSALFIQQVAQATDIVDLISQYVAMKKRGREFLGLCPFHDDHKPSMNVSATKQIFKCFSCGAGGTVFNFLMLYDKLSFPEAVEALAQRANIPLPQASIPRPGEGELTKNDLLAVTAFAARFFADRLHAPQGAEALAYARGRGMTDESIESFALGYAPNAWDSLLTAARAKGIGHHRLLAAGLAVKHEQKGSCYDRFRNRLIFPILDPAGKMIAFGGRALAEDERAKYLNSPETPVFDKSSNLYGLSWARPSIVSAGQAVVVEGYLDALIPMQAGVGNVVATLGTALTDRHIRLLGRYAREIILIFDADDAGTAAAERALELFLTQQIHVRVATIPAGKDPCDYCLAQGADALRALIAGAPDALQFVWDRRQRACIAAGNNQADRRRLVEDFLRLVASSSVYGAIDEIRRGQVAQHIGHMLNIPLAELQGQMKRLVRRIRPVARPAEQAQPLADGPTQRAERQLLEVLLNECDLFDDVHERIDPHHFRDPALRAVAECVWRFGVEGQLCLENVLASEELADYGSVLADLATAGELRGNYQPTVNGAVELMQYHADRADLREIRAGGLDDDALRRLQQRLKAPDARRRPKRT